MNRVRARSPELYGSAQTQNNRLSSLVSESCCKRCHKRLMKVASGFLKLCHTYVSEIDPEYPLANFLCILLVLQYYMFLHHPAVPHGIEAFRKSNVYVLRQQHD